jgi:hypothetical protein
MGHVLYSFGEQACGLDVDPKGDTQGHVGVTACGVRHFSTRETKAVEVHRCAESLCAESVTRGGIEIEEFHGKTKSFIGLEVREPVPTRHL